MIKLRILFLFYIVQQTMPHPSSLSIESYRNFLRRSSQFFFFNQNSLRKCLDFSVSSHFSFTQIAILLGLNHVGLEGSFMVVCLGET